MHNHSIGINEPENYVLDMILKFGYDNNGHEELHKNSFS